MKIYLTYLTLFLLIVLLAVQAEAAEVYCSLNDGNKSDGKTSLEYEGKKHEFCCSGCLDQFKMDPKKFAQQVQQPGLTSTADAEAACSSVCSG